MDENTEVQVESQIKTLKRVVIILCVALCLLVAIIIAILVIASSRKDYQATVSSNDIHVNETYEIDDSNETEQERFEEAITETSIDEETVIVSEKDMVKKTDESITVYLSLLGMKTEGQSVDMSIEFVNGLNSVYLMGELGEVSHGYTEDGGDDTIGFMEWKSNHDNWTHDSFIDFTNLLDVYWGSEATLRDIDDISEESESVK